MELIKLRLGEIGVIDQQVDRLVNAKRQQSGMVYGEALLACAREHPRLFAARERLLSGQSQEELFRVEAEAGGLIAVDRPMPSARQKGPYEELFLALVAERVASTRLLPKDAHRQVARENPEVFRHYCSETGGEKGDKNMETTVSAVEDNAVGGPARLDRAFPGVRPVALKAVSERERMRACPHRHASKRLIERALELEAKKLPKGRADQ
jgi:hypothetical protein